MAKKPAPHPRLKAGGRRLWRSFVDVFELDEHEATLLLQACRLRDVLDALAETVATDGPVIDGESGPRVHPAAVEQRLQSLALARVLASLRLPADEEEPAERPQRRGAVRVRIPGACREAPPATAD